MYSDAIKEAYAMAPVDSVTYETLEIQHALDPSIYLVAANEDKQLRLEDNTLVTFKYAPFTLKLPKSGSGGDFSMSLTMFNYQNVVSNYLQTVKGTGRRIKAIYRPYLSTDTTKMPQLNPPMTLYLTNININKLNVTATASFSDVVNKKVPTKRYDPNIYTSL